MSGLGFYAGLLCAQAVLASHWQRVAPDLRLDYPRDHASHPEYRTEWWYLTGHLETADETQLGFQFTVFRQGIDPLEPRADDPREPAPDIFAGHLALADPSAAALRVAERIRPAGALAHASTSDLELHLEDWSLVRDEHDHLRLVAGDAAAGFHLELECVPDKPLVLHGSRGYSQKGPEPGNASAYVSWTRSSLNGTLTSAMGPLAVTGSAWFDHEYGTSQLPPGAVGWDWFAVQLDDGRELMLYRLRDSQGRVLPFSAGTWIEVEGTSRPLAARDFHLDAIGSWTSARSQAIYPAAWRLRVPYAGLDLRLEPWLADCELDTRRSTGVIYWEGPVRCTGSHTGRGFAELTGYAGSLEGVFGAR